MKGEKGWCDFSVYGAPLDDWANDGSVDVFFFTHGEYGFSSMGSWCYAKAHFPFPYSKPATEHYPQEFTNTLHSLVDFMNR